MNSPCQNEIMQGTHEYTIIKSTQTWARKTTIMHLTNESSKCLHTISCWVWNNINIHFTCKLYWQHSWLNYIHDNMWIPHKYYILTLNFQCLAAENHTERAIHEMNDHSWAKRLDRQCMPCPVKWMKHTKKTTQIFRVNTAILVKYICNSLMFRFRSSSKNATSWMLLTLKRVGLEWGGTPQ